VLKRYYIIFMLLVLPALGMLAQNDPSFSHYWALEPSFNPAAVGKEQKINVTGAYAMTLTGFENNPRTMYAAADMPFYAMKSYHGIGAQFMNDQIGHFSHKKFALQYAYRHKLFGGMLALGAHLGMISETFNGSNIDLPDNQTDNAVPTSEVTGSAIDLGAGLYYATQTWYVGASALHLNGPDVQMGEKQNFKWSPTYYLTGGYNIQLNNPFVSIHPSVLGRTDGVAYRVDISARVKYVNDKKVMYAGLAYSPTNSVTAMIGGNFHGVSLGYSYEVYTSSLSFGNGSHEIFIGYQTDINLTKKGRNLHKSVRIL
jgi:type IX secretion system PorP/SprF family membrane protein